MIIPGNNSHHQIILPLIYNEYHIYLPLKILASQPMPVSAHSAVSVTEETTMTWTYAKYIIESVNKQVCDHLRFSYMKVLLDGNGVGSTDADKYVKNEISPCNEF